jgi:hypothetical protein
VPFIDGRTLAAPSLRFNAAVRRCIGGHARGREARGGLAVHRWHGCAARAGATRGGCELQGSWEGAGCLGKVRGGARTARQARRGRSVPGVPPGATSRHDVDLFQLALFEREILQKFE